MAGDWIKMEHATACKPEVVLAAQLLCISRREMLGILVDYWIWLDANLDESRHGMVTHVSRKSLEETLHCAGLAAVLEYIKWAEFDDEQRIMTVKNWDRHNGKTAKSRALTRDRQARKRLQNRHANVTLVALPEKRREESNTNSVGTNQNPTPKDPSETWESHWIAKAKALGIEAKRGESASDFCRRVMQTVRGS
jgi:hypothetical protein